MRCPCSVCGNNILGLNRNTLMILPGSLTTTVLESLYWLLISHNFWTGIEDEQLYPVLYPNWPFPGLEDWAENVLCIPPHGVSSLPRLCTEEAAAAFDLSSFRVLDWVTHQVRHVLLVSGISPDVPWQSRILEWDGFHLLVKIPGIWLIIHSDN